MIFTDYPSASANLEDLPSSLNIYCGKFKLYLNIYIKPRIIRKSKK